MKSIKEPMSVSTRVLRIVLLLCMCSDVVYAKCDLITNPTFLTSWSGEVTNPGPTGEYPVNQNCTWNIQVSQGSRIRLTFEVFNLEPKRGDRGEASVCRDYIEVFDMSRSVTELGQFCGNNNPAPMTSTSNELDITFISDDVFGGRGFRISYTGICDNIISGPGGTVAFIESPNLAEVSVNTACTWTLKGIGSVPSVVAINPTQTVEECALSPVKVYDTRRETLGSICSIEAPPIVANGGEMVIVYSLIDGSEPLSFMLNVTFRAMETCVPGRCLNGGTCLDDTSRPKCSCVRGFEGRTCEVDKDECLPTPCENNGECIDLPGEYRCECPSGFSGKNCQQTSDSCSTRPCLNAGTCTANGNEFSCTCAVGFTGDKCQIEFRECEPNPCQNGGTCRDEPTGYQCDCVNGFVGVECETEAIPCNEQPCLNGGVCNVVSGSFDCTCRIGVTGKRCETIMPPCFSDPCENGGTCLNDAASYQCQCLENYSGVQCEQLMDACHSNPCLNDGTCIFFEGGFACECPSGITGYLCDVETNGCKSDPCKNGGICANDDDGFKCSCQEKWSGKTCETFLKACSPNPCENEGTCIDTSDGFRCKCETGFLGNRCEIDVNECDNDPCLNNGVCKNEYGTFTCTCTDLFTGSLCHLELNECTAGICKNGGTCVNNREGFECACVPGFSGRFCDATVDGCASDPCQNDANCVSVTGTFICECSLGYQGPTCDEEIDECLKNPCQNGGTCTDLVNSYRCACADGYTGDTCDTNADDCSSMPCINGGICQDELLGYTCVCEAGFTGTDCEVNVDDCRPDYCEHDGTCLDGVDTFVCRCTDEYTGPTCGVYKFQDDPHCIEEVDMEPGSELLWTNTLAGQTSERSCGPGIIGNASRSCIRDEGSPTGGFWSKPELRSCINPAFLELANKANLLSRSIDIHPKAILEVTDSLVNITSPKGQGSGLYPGDLILVTDTMGVVANVLYEVTETIEYFNKIAQGYGGAIDNVVDMRTLSSWRNMRDPDLVDNQISSLMSSTEKMAESLAKNSKNRVKRNSDSPETLLSVTTKNLNLRVTRYHQNVYSTLQVPHKNSSLVLPTELLALAKQVSGESSVQVYDATFSSISALLSLDDSMGNDSDAQTVNSDVISIKILGVPELNFQKLISPVILEFRMKDIDVAGNATCVYMNMSAMGKLDRWAVKGCTLYSSNDTHVTCHCNHMTNFALLMDVYGIAPDIGSHEEPLSFISYIGGTLSLLGCLLAIAVFEYFRLSSDRVRIHEMLAVSIILVQLIFLIGIERKENMYVCKAIAIILHYSLMSMFCWMLVEGIHLYIVLVRVFKRGSHLKKYMCAGWVVPLVIVGISVGVFADDYGQGSICWMTTFMLWILFVPTIALVIILNSVILVIVVRVMLRSMNSTSKANVEEQSSIRIGLKAAVVLLPLLGLTWTFAFLSIDAENTIVFTYIFTVLNSLQGVFFFVFHCLQNVDVRTAFDRRYRRHKRLMTADRTSSYNRKSASTDEDYFTDTHNAKYPRNSTSSIDTNATDVSTLNKGDNSKQREKISLYRTYPSYENNVIHDRKKDCKNDVNSCLNNDNWKLQDKESNHPSVHRTANDNFDARKHSFDNNYANVNANELNRKGCHSDRITPPRGCQWRCIRNGARSSEEPRPRSALFVN